MSGVMRVDVTVSATAYRSIIRALRFWGPAQAKIADKIEENTRVAKQHKKPRNRKKLTREQYLLNKINRIKRKLANV